MHASWLRFSVRQARYTRLEEILNKKKTNLGKVKPLT